MITVIEGPDGAGKTTLAEHLKGMYQQWCMGKHDPQVSILHTGPPDPPDRNPFDEYETRLLEHVPADPSDMLICDRWALGELVYGPIFRGMSRLSPGGMLHVEMFLQGRGAARMILLPPLNWALPRLRARGDEMLQRGKEPLDEGELAGIWDHYRRLHTDYPGIMVDGIPGDPAFTGQLLELMQKAARRAREMARIGPGYIGNLNADVIIAGDVRGDHDNPEAPWRHAFTPAAHGSASYLMGALASWSRVMIQSAGILNTGEDGVNLRRVDALMSSPRWVALGANAEKRLKDAGIKCSKVPHPQWQRRFRYGEQEVYGKAIMQAAQLA